MKINIIFWTEGGNVEKTAHAIEKKLVDNNVSTFSVNNINYNALKEADLIIMGGSTVGADHWENDNYQDIWSNFFKTLPSKNISLKNKKVALFGLGNHILYPEHFVDHLKELYTYIQKTEATLIGQCSTEGYDFTSSKAIVNSKFVGLPLDEDTQKDLTEERIDKWIKNLDL